MADKVTPELLPTIPKQHIIAEIAIILLVPVEEFSGLKRHLLFDILIVFMGIKHKSNKVCFSWLTAFFKSLT
jgi:hypothetical protein